MMGPAPQARPGFRADVDGLRAVAILLVVAFHARVPGLTGGFVGVDVFFVISGFLITRLLWSELERTSRISLIDFWLRRFRRLAPLLAVVVLTTLLAALLVHSPLQWAGLARQALAAGLYVSNILFAVDADRYFQAVPANSPFLHTWSLGVEEQFYLVWPLLVVLAAGATWAGASVRLRLIRMLAVLLVASFGLSLVLSLRGTPWAFYSLPTRAWELGAGGLLVFAEGRLRLRESARRALGWIGAAALILAATGLDGLMPYPGWAALLPVLGTVALIAGGGAAEGGARTWLERGLASKPAQAIGRLSYAWYLWHWPALALVDGYLLSEPAPVPLRCLVVTAALVLAFASHHAIENPIRFGQRLAVSRRLSAAVAVLALGSVALASAATRWAAARAMADPYLSGLAAAAEPPELVVCDPSTGTGCAYGDPAGELVVLLFGDSHAAQWLPALDRAAAELGVRVVAATRGGCPPFPILIARSGSRQPSERCLAHRARVLEMVEESPPDAVILASAAYASRVLVAPGEFAHHEEVERAWQRALGEGLAYFREREVPVGLILDNPGKMGRPVECLARRRTLSRCEVEAQRALASLDPLRPLQLQAAWRGEVTAVYDPVPEICSDGFCQAVVDGHVAYLDSDHLSAGFVLRRALATRTLLTSLLGSVPGTQRPPSYE